MTSVLLGFDLTPSEGRVARFRYLWKEALAKLQNGETDDMTTDEQLLAQLQDEHLAQTVRLTDLIRDVALITKTDQAPQLIAREEVDVEQVIGEVRDELHTGCQFRRGKGLGHIVVSPGQIGRAHV